MTKARDIAAENVSDVVELIRMRRQSGLLSIERIQDGLFEEGEIFFQNGQPIFAHQGQTTGTEALSRMLNWHHIYFAFLTDSPQPAANIPASIRTRANVAIATDPRSQSVNPFWLKPDTASPFESRSREDGAGVNAQTSSSLSSNIPGLEWLVPQKLGNDRNVLSLPLTRPQRSIYLLIDGKRTVSDLARCTRKSFQEIERLLSELQERGLISI